jgi:hypothetical protein
VVKKWLKKWWKDQKSIEHLWSRPLDSFYY